MLPKVRSQGEINRPSLLIGEVRNLLSYKDKKEAQLQKLNRVQNKIEFYHQLQSEFANQLKDYKYRWNQNFHLLGIEEQSIEDDKWGQLFPLISKCEISSKIVADLGKPFKNEEIFSQKNIARPLSLLTLQGGVDNAERIEFLKLLELRSPHSNLLIIIEDSSLAGMMKKLEIGSSQPVGQRKPQAKTKPLEKNKSPQPVMSEKAKAALELFKARNVGASS